MSTFSRIATNSSSPMPSCTWMFSARCAATVSSRARARPADENGIVDQAGHVCRRVAGHQQGGRLDFADVEGLTVLDEVIELAAILQECALEVVERLGVLMTRPEVEVEDRQERYVFYSVADQAVPEIRAVLCRIHCPKDSPMTIDWNAFTPWSALAGGALIGLAAAMFVLLNGRIAGISGIVGGLLSPSRGDLAWRAAFVVGLVGAPLLYGLFAAAPQLRIDAGYGALVVSGLLVGIGTRCGSGCTSGHGVCGLSRWSMRSLAATGAFMGAGFVTVFLLRHVFFV
jgi:uncharacterized protein